jgi:hypothetical protein
VAKENARLERGDVSDPKELVFTKTHQRQRVRYKLCPEGKRGATSSQRVQGQLRSSKTQGSCHRLEAALILGKIMLTAR